MHADPLLDRVQSGSGGAAFAQEFHLAVGVVPAAAFEIAVFQGTEAMSDLYAFDVVAGVDPTVAELLRIGDPARLTIPTRGGVRSVHGVVSEIVRAAADTGRETLRIRIVPALFALTKRTSTRVFQGLPVDAIVGRVLEEHAVPFQLRLSAPHAPREYAVQYHETDYELVTRLMAEEGLAFWFEHPPVPAELPATPAVVREVLVITDTSAAYAAEPTVLGFRPGLAALSTPDSADCTALRRAERLEPTAAAVRRWDFARASSNAGQAVPIALNEVPSFRGGVISQARSGDAPRPGPTPLEWYEPHGHEHGLRVESDLLDRKLAQLRTLSETVTLSTSERGLSPGRVFVVLDQDVIPPASPMVVLRAFHHGSHRSTDDHRYRAEIVGAPRSVLGRAPVPPRRMAQVVESAVVVGAPGREIDTDEHGRVKIQFTWDRAGTHDDGSSCWVRVAQPWSGSQYGFQFVPRIGTEVLVSFLGGDPDRPVVIACLPNLANALPFAIPDQVTKSGIRTQSTPREGGGRYNELSFDDRSGGELVYLRAQKNHEVVVLENQTERIGGAHRTSVAGERITEVDGDDAVRVGGSRTEQIAGDVTQAILAGAESNVARDRVARVGGAERVEAEQAILAQAGGEVRIQAGVRQPSNAYVIASNEARLVGAKCVRLHSPQSIEIRSGDSALSIGPDGITLTAKALKLVAADTLELVREKTSLKLTDKVELGSDEIKLETEQASLLLTKTDAELHGVAVKLAGPKGATRSAAAKDPAQAQPAKFQIRRPEGYDGPLTAVVSLPTGEIVERSVDASGTLSFDGFEGEEFHLLEIRMGDERVSHGTSD